MKKMAPFPKYLILLTFIISSSYATLLPFPSPLPRVETSYDSILSKTWQGIKKRNIDPYDVKLVHRPKSEYPGDCVSEGVGYGMVIALYCNDQTYFNTIWHTAEDKMWQGQFYDWWLGEDGKKSGSPSFLGAATDAEEDVAIALIFADQLCKKGIWDASKASYRDTTYAQRAKTILESIKRNMLEGAVLRPGANWGGVGFVNPGYFAPAYYRVFAEFDSTSKATWMSVVDQCYTTIEANPGYSKGLVPDWMKSNGEFTTPQGYNPTGNGRWLYKDAIRVYWRIATDYLWYDEPRAKRFLQNAMNFLKTPDKANFYTMDGDVVPVDSTFTLGNGEARSRREHSHLTIGMWACASVIDSVLANSFSNELLKYYDPGADYWGRATDPDGNNEDTLHNETYFEQFLAWFGASTIAGVYTNIWEDMKDPDPTTPLAWVKEPSLNSQDFDANTSPLKITAELNKAVRWTVSLVCRNDSSKTVFYSGSGTQIDVTWLGLGASGVTLPQGWYDVTITAKGMKTPVKREVWLGRALDIMSNGKLIVDDFKDGDLIANLGKWTDYMDNRDGRPGKSTITKYAIEKSGTQNELHFGFHLDQGGLGYDPFAALEWNIQGTDSANLDLSGVDTIYVTAAATSPVGVSMQFIATDVGGDNFLEDSLYLTTTMTEFKVPIADLMYRFGGGKGTITYSKLTAIRFQAQLASGTEKEIIIQKLALGGDLSKLYTSPPPYIKMSTKPVKRASKISSISYSVHADGIRLVAPSAIKGSELIVFDMMGKAVAKQVVNRSLVTIPLSKVNSANRLYFAKVQCKNGVAVVPISVVK